MKQILFIDDSCPKYDQSAGARSSFMYLTLLVDMGYAVTFYPCDLNKIEPYSTELEKLGIKILGGYLFKLWWRCWFVLNAAKFDIVFFNRPSIAKSKMKYFNGLRNIKKIYQCHDLHFLRLLRQYELTKNKQLLEESSRFEKMECEIYKKTDVALTFSSLEKQIIDEKFVSPKTVVVPLFFYKYLNSPIRDFTLRQNIIYVGGFSHAPNVDAVLWFCREILPVVRQKITKLKLLVVGSNPPPEIRALEVDGVELLCFQTDDQIYALYQTIRMVVVPLRFGAGVKGKVIEAIYNCVPIVSTSIGLEGIDSIESIIKPSNTIDEFSESLISLYQDENRLKSMSLALSAYSENNFSIKKVRKILNDILD